MVKINISSVCNEEKQGNRSLLLNISFSIQQIAGKTEIKLSGVSYFEFFYYRKQPTSKLNSYSSNSENPLKQAIGG